jgi:hypothetical protein
MIFQTTTAFSRNSPSGDRIGPSDTGLCLARCEPGKGLLALMRGKLLTAAEPHAAIR